MKTYKYTDETNKVVHVIDEDGKSRMSCLASVLEKGTEIEPADPIPEPTYQEKRKPEYPPSEDYLDGIVKNDQAQIDKYIADCLAVKVKYPKE